MNPKSLGIAGLMALGALALIAVIASNPFTTQASTHEPGETQRTTERLSADVAAVETAKPQQFDLLQGTDEDSDDSKPYIGVQITELDDGSVKVVSVMASGPSDGVLMPGDVITAVDGNTIGGSSDLIDAIATAGPDTAITLTVTRDGSSLTVDVTVGDRKDSTVTLRKYRTGRENAPHAFGYFRSGRSHPSGRLHDSGRVVHSQTTVENEDGTFRTKRAVIGTVSDIDTSAGTFTLTPKDGSEAIDYMIGDDTKVIMNRNGDLGALNTEDDTLVVDVDGEVTMVQQGVGAEKMGRSYRSGKRLGLRGGGKLPGRGYFSGRSTHADSVFEVLRSRLPDRS